jgi:hypothetical protein
MAARSSLDRWFAPLSDPNSHRTHTEHVQNAGCFFGEKGTRNCNASSILSDGHDRKCPYQRHKLILHSALQSIGAMWSIFIESRVISDPFSRRVQLRLSAVVLGYLVGGVCAGKSSDTLFTGL